MNCKQVCVPDPPYAGVCPAACSGGCPGGVCNIVCDGSDPATSCTQTFNKFQQIEKPPVKCPQGMPCKVTCTNGGCGANIISCPRGPESCEIDCGANGCGGPAHLYCGAGPCNVHGATGPYPSHFPFTEYNTPDTICGASCACDLPYPAVWGGAGGVRCQCKDYQLVVGGPPANERCPIVCAAHGGWSAPWDRTPNTW
ncbi:MAG TPA: hypothetical protein VLT33_16940 [Labilithrix sp.]|nr:hypothetical protein [Labilithrix sp.]